MKGRQSSNKVVKYTSKIRTNQRMANGLTPDGKRIILISQSRCKVCKRFLKDGHKFRKQTKLLLCPEHKKEYKNKQRKIYNSDPQIKKEHNKYVRKRYKEDPEFRKRAHESNKKWRMKNKEKVYKYIKKWLKSEKGKEYNRKNVRKCYYKNIEYYRLYKRTRAYVKRHINELKIGDVF